MNLLVGYEVIDRIQEIQSQLDKQYQLIRLIVQKMEIKNEMEEYDEGCHRSSIGSTSNTSASAAVSAKSRLKQPTGHEFSPSRVRAKMIPIVEVMKQRKKRDSADV